MKKTSIVFLVSGICMISGLLLAGAGIAAGASNSVYLTKEGIQIPKGDHLMNEKKDVEKFDRIEIDVSDIDVQFVASDHFGMEYSLNEQTIIKQLGVENGTFYFKTEQQFLFSLFNFNINEEYLTVYYPSGTEFDSIKADTISGGIEIADCKSKDINLHTTSGKIIANNITGKKIVLKSVSGRVESSSSSFEAFSVSTTSGGISLEKIDIASDTEIQSLSGGIHLSEINGQKLNLKNTSGSIKLSNSSFSKIDGANTSGSVNCEGLKSGGIVFKTSSGSLKLYGNLSGDNELSSISGTVVFQTSLTRDQFQGDFHSLSGTIRVNDNDTENIDMNSNAENSININTTSGNIKVYFDR